jgi:PIN domain nuclease of toxin-antitoxin system
LLERIQVEGFEALAITAEHAIAAGRVPRHHRDLFDRMLVAQARVERMMLVSSDPVFARYKVSVLSA